MIQRVRLISGFETHCALLRNWDRGYCVVHVQCTFVVNDVHNTVTAWLVMLHY